MATLHKLPLALDENSMPITMAKAKRLMMGWDGDRVIICWTGRAGVVAGCGVLHAPNPKEEKEELGDHWVVEGVGGVFGRQLKYPFMFGDDDHTIVFSINGKRFDAFGVVQKVE